jgi:adenylylsulfate kinase
MKQQGVTVWFTGLSSSGKTTIAREVTMKLAQRNYRVELLDGDIIRNHFSKDLGFSREDRDTNIRRISFVAQLLSRNEVIVIVATISPYKSIRNEVRQAHKNFVEVYVNTPLDICEKRDVKGLYAKARAGEIRHFTGIDDPYEEPQKPEVTCFTAQESIEESVASVITALEVRHYIT